jgi:hypothetical protein
LKSLNQNKFIKNYIKKDGNVFRNYKDDFENFFNENFFNYKVFIKNNFNKIKKEYKPNQTLKSEFLKSSIKMVNMCMKHGNKLKFLRFLNQTCFLFYFFFKTNKNIFIKRFENFDLFENFSKTHLHF